MARELFFTGRKIDAEEAQRIGLVSRVLPDAELMASAMELAEEMAAKAPTALASMKRNLNDNVDNDLEDSIKVEAMRIGPLLGGAENKEAASAFLQKRPPNFD
jgi:enoyl-CoA hydratase/carnithine racemase